MGCWPSTLEIFGLESPLSSIVSLPGLPLTHSGLWYLKRRPLMDHNLFILVFKKSAPSKERSGCVYNKMKPPTWTIHTCTGVKQKRPLPPTWFSLQAKTREDERDRAGLTLHPRGLQIQPEQGWLGKQTRPRRTLDTIIWRWDTTWDVCTEIIQLALTVRKTV